MLMPGRFLTQWGGGYYDEVFGTGCFNAQYRLLGELDDDGCHSQGHLFLQTGLQAARGND
jgi:hypothetical protein